MALAGDKVGVDAIAVDGEQEEEDSVPSARAPGLV